MDNEPISPVVYDAGALVAAERGEQRFVALHRRWLAAAVSPVVPAPVLAQVWRDGARQARLAQTLRGCHILPTSAGLAKAAGKLLGRSGTADVVDAIVVATAVALHATVVTSDLDDVTRLWYASTARSQAAVIAV